MIPYDAPILHALLGLVAFVSLVAALTLLIWLADRPTERRTHRYSDRRRRHAGWDS